MNEQDWILHNGQVRQIKDAKARQAIGDLDTLETEAKGSLVEAINEAAHSGGGGGVELDRTLTYANKAAPADLVGKLKDDIADKLTKPESGIAVGKYFRVASLDAEGNPVLEAVDLPVASIARLGLTTAGLGLDVDSEGKIRNKVLDNLDIDAKNSNSGLITTSRIDRAVRAGLISNTQITTADYPAIHKTLGIERPWVLKGTLTTENMGDGVTVDLTGCSEMYINGVCDCTTINLRANGYAVAYRSGPLKKIVASYENSPVGFVCKYAKYADNLDALTTGTTMTGYDRIDGTKISDIKSIALASAVYTTLCNIEIYAR